MKDEGRKTQGGEVQNVWRASTLFEEDKETNKEVNQAEKIYVKNLRRPAMNGAKIIEVSAVEPRVFRVRKASPSGSEADHEYQPRRDKSAPNEHW